LETLESRRLLAIFHPSPGIADGAAGSLRAAIIAANGNGVDDTIHLAGGTYKLTKTNSGGQQENAALTGDLDVNEAGRVLTIQGQGESSVIDARRIDRVLQVAPDVTLILRDVVLYAGRAFDDGTVGSTSSPGTVARGGGILSDIGSRVFLHNTIVHYCSAQGLFGTGQSVEGGGLYIEGELIAYDSAVRLNHVTTRFTSDVPGQFARGGGIAAVGDARVVLDGSSIAENKAQGGGTEASHPGSGDGLGGGLYSQGNVRLRNTQVEKNQALSGARVTDLWSTHAAGGGLYIEGELLVENVLVRGNIAHGSDGAWDAAGSPGSESLGGGIYASRINGTGLEVSGNRADAGAGMAGKDATGDEAGGTGGAAARAAGGGIYVAESASIAQLVLVGNRADGGDAGRGGNSQNGNGGAGGPTASAEVRGGGLAGPTSLTVELYQPRIESNMVEAGGGGRGGDSAAGLGGIASLGATAAGGGLFAGSVTIQRGSVLLNTALAVGSNRDGLPAATAAARDGVAAAGGGIFVYDSAIISDSTLSNNDADGGQGGPGQLAPNGDVLIAPGVGGPATGGAIHVADGATLLLTNSTLSRNVATAGRGGYGGDADPNQPTVGGTGGRGGVSRGGGIHLSPLGATATIHNSTIAFNTAAIGAGGLWGSGATDGQRGEAVPGEGGGIYSGGTGDSSTLHVTSTILGQNIAGVSPDIVGHFTSAKYVLLQNSSATGISDGVNGNILGKDPKLGTLADNGGPTKTHVPLPGSPVIDRGSNPSQLATDQRGLPRLSGNRVDIGAVELQIPKVFPGPGIHYLDNRTDPLILAPDAIVTDLDSPDFNGGRLIVKATENANDLDRLSIIPQGSTLGKIGRVGNKVTYSGVTIGTVSGGVGMTPLVVVFSSSQVTIASVQALVRRIAFYTDAENPPGLQLKRPISFQIFDGDGVSSDAAGAIKVVNLISANDPPVLGGIGGSIGYVRNSAAIVVAGSATVTDPDSPNFKGGKLTIKITGGSDASNRLELGGDFRFSTTNVFYKDRVIGTRNANGGMGTTELQITFYEQFYLQGIQSLIRSVRFRTFQSTNTVARVISFHITDGDGGESNTVSKTVNVQG
jgi:hypothetical protein